MYLEHFGLSELPFTLTPNTAFLLDRGAQREALNVLLVALSAGDGFVKITGEVGTGKTLLCRRLLNALDEAWVSAYLPNPCLNPHSMRAALAEELGAGSGRSLGPQRVLKTITERLLELAAAGRRVVLIIDEAQTIPDDSLEAVRLLGNLETERDKLLQVVLVGQPELDSRLSLPHLRQLRQRIGFSYRLQPLGREAVGDYLDFRVRKAGYSGECLFDTGAKRLVFRATRGVPRLVNIIAHKALLAAYGDGTGRVGASHVRRAVADTEDAFPLSRWRSPLLPAAALLAAIGGGAALAAGLLPQAGVS